MAVVDVNSNELMISILLTPEAKIGDWVMVHAGFAMQTMEQAEAQESLELMLELKKIRESFGYE